MNHVPHTELRTHLTVMCHRLKTGQKYLSGCDHLAASYRLTLCTQYGWGQEGHLEANLVSKHPPFMHRQCAGLLCTVAVHPGPCLQHMSTFDKALLFLQQYSPARPETGLLTNELFMFICEGVCRRGPHILQRKRLRENGFRKKARC